MNKELFDQLKYFCGIIACDGVENVSVMSAQKYFEFTTIKLTDVDNNPVNFINEELVYDEEQLEQVKVKVLENNWFIKY